MMKDKSTLTFEGLDAVLSSTQNDSFQDEDSLPQDVASLQQAFNKSEVFTKFRKQMLFQLLTIGNRGCSLEDLRNSFDSVLRMAVITGVQWERNRAMSEELEKMVTE